MKTTLHCTVCTDRPTMKIGSDAIVVVRSVDGHGDGEKRARKQQAVSRQNPRIATMSQRSQLIEWTSRWKCLRDEDRSTDCILRSAFLT